MKTIVSFGDSFIYGSELQDNLDGSKAWPGLIAKRLNHDYKTFAVPGCGNEAIARQVFSYYSSSPSTNTLAIINWTWCMRWDFYLFNIKEWIALGPTCVPDRLKNVLSTANAQELIDFYRTHVNEAYTWNQLRSLQAILATQSFLKINNIKNIQTYIDRELFVPSLSKSRLEHYNAFKDSSWPDIVSESELSNLPDYIRTELDNDYHAIAEPEYIQTLQKLTWKEMQDFEGHTFLEWSRNRRYKITPAPGDHPLEQAHHAAADLWEFEYQQQLK